MKSLKALLLPALLLAGTQVFAQDKELQVRFMDEKDPVKKDSLFSAIKRSPWPTTNAQEEATKLAALETLRARLAVAYLEKKDAANYTKHLDQMKFKTMVANVLNSSAWAWAEKGERLNDAADFSKRSLGIVTDAINDPAQASVKKRLESQYDSFADTYAYILLKQNKPKEALTYQTPVYEHSKGEDAEVTEHYVQMLAADGQHAKALEIAETSVRAGKSTGELRDAFQAAFIKVNGAKGWPAYWAAIEKSQLDNLTTTENLAKIDEKKKELTTKMINEPAPLFTLKDLDGKTVSLADLKGKTVIVDYWATWCGPCKASFPGMQLAVNKYKNDPNVAFLFINTRERGNNYLPGVKKFIADNKYTFRVLVDEADEKGRQAKVISTYKVTGIPTKFIIDKEGNIRFKQVGFGGGAEGVYNEVVAMIDLLKNGPETKEPKVSMNK